MNVQDFYEGRSFDAYMFWGAHVSDGGVWFRTYAPGAAKVLVIGEWNGWKGEEMQEEPHGFFTFFSPQATAGMMYKYKIFGPDGGQQDHCDPYGFAMEHPPACASIICAPSDFSFTDGGWMKSRSKNYDAPLNIYEVHMGSWKRRQDGSVYTYRELGKQLIPYVREMGFTHIELMPICEYPYDPSWGYQITGYFSPTARYGTPDDLRSFVNSCHAAGIGVLLDFVPAHFALDSYGLRTYPGTELYEYPHSDVGISEWGSCNFLHARGEVRSFLMSAANYWLTEFHFDGLRMDAVSRIIYWQGDPARGENGKGVEFLKVMNEGLNRLHPTAVLIAEDSTTYPKVTAPVAYGGLGFDYKWDLGWMNDTLRFCALPPEHRPEAYHDLTFSMAYFYRELYLLPFSHDETVHGKKTIVDKMWGSYEQKFHQARLLYLYMMVHPGKKLNFMGNELAQLREWGEGRQQDWELLRFPIHEAFHRYFRLVGEIYGDHQALWQGEYNEANFRWLCCDDSEACVYALERIGTKERIAAVFNFSDREQTFTLPPSWRNARLLVDTAWETFGGTHRQKDHEGPNLRLAPFSGQALCRSGGRERA